MEKLGPDTNALNWFEIPVHDMPRAQTFYETIFEVQLTVMNLADRQMCLFPSQVPKIGGAIVKSPIHHPSRGGTILYLNANPDLKLVLNRIEAAGGKIIMPKTNIGNGLGYMAYFVDTEGNMLALHSGA